MPESACDKSYITTVLNRSHKKKYSLKTFTWLLFMSLQYFFTRTRPHRVHKSFLAKIAVHYLYYLKSYNIVGQIKTTNTEKQ